MEYNIINLFGLDELSVVRAQTHTHTHTIAAVKRIHLFHPWLIRLNFDISIWALIVLENILFYSQCAYLFYNLLQLDVNLNTKKLIGYKISRLARGI